VTNNEVPKSGFAEAGADLELVGISKRFPGFTAIEELDLTIPAGRSSRCSARRAAARRPLSA